MTRTDGGHAARLAAFLGQAEPRRPPFPGARPLDAAVAAVAHGRRDLVVADRRSSAGNLLVGSRPGAL